MIRSFPRSAIRSAPGSGPRRRGGSRIRCAGRTRGAECRFAGPSPVNAIPAAAPPAPASRIATEASRRRLRLRAASRRRLARASTRPSLSREPWRTMRDARRDLWDSFAVGRLLGRYVGRFSSLAEVFTSRDLRRLQLGWAGFYVSEWTSFVAFSIYAYRVGGAGALGLLGLVRMLPSTVGVLAGTALADRTQRERVLLGVHLLRAATLASAAVVLAVRGPLAGVFLLAALTAVVGA